MSIITSRDCAIACFSPSSEPCATSMILIIFCLIDGDNVSLLAKLCLRSADPAIMYPWTVDYSWKNYLFAYSQTTFTKLNLLSTLNLANLTDDCPPLLWLRMISLLTSFNTLQCAPFKVARIAELPSITIKPNVSSFTSTSSLI